MLHLSHASDEDVRFTLEVDRKGDNVTVTVPVWPPSTSTWR